MEKQIPKGLKVFSIEEIEKAQKNAQEEFGWDFNNEREFMENLFCQRFNFLLVVYSLFLAAAAATDSQTNMTIVLYLGSFLTLLISITIWRCYVKLNIILKFLHNIPKHPFYFINKETKALKLLALTGINLVIGLWIPLFCFASLLAGAILSHTNILTAA